jgi:hypothetical protein
LGELQPRLIDQQRPEREIDRHRSDGDDHDDQRRVEYGDPEPETVQPRVIP